ncbi:efflux RND transporter periplasmic adaptor subunit [Aestuariivirga sp.]|uniref:efflux RND transporter periplasmic adaptor subunit n=1 Tax=Aestuariivirga sp. TaxID=2650926 RepID=UPI0039E5C34F
MNIMTQPSRADVETALDLTAARKGRKWARRLVWIAVLAVIAAGGLYAYERYSAAREAIVYDTKTAEVTNLTVTVSATGTIQPITQVDVSSELSGVIRTVNVDDNSIVKKGDTLATLDTERLDAQKAKSEAQLAGAEAKLQDARATLDQRQTAADRQKDLRKRGLSTEQDLQSASADLARATASVAAAEADLASAKADLAILEADLKRAVIAAPIDGVVLKRAAEPGQTVASSLQAPVLFTLAQDLTRVQLEAAVDEADMGAVKTGQKAGFSVDAYRGRNFPAQIERLSYAPETVDGVVTYKAILSAPNEDLALRPGMTATAKIITEDYANVLTVPNEALRYAPPRVETSRGFSITQIFMPRFPRSERGTRDASPDGMRDVYVLRHGVAEKISIKTGSSDGRRTVVLSGELKAGDKLITAQRTAAASGS